MWPTTADRQEIVIRLAREESRSEQRAEKTGAAGRSEGRWSEAQGVRGEASQREVREGESEERRPQGGAK